MVVTTLTDNAERLAKLDWIIATELDGLAERTAARRGERSEVSCSELIARVLTVQALIGAHGIVSGRMTALDTAATHEHAREHFDTDLPELARAVAALR